MESRDPDNDPECGLRHIRNICRSTRRKINGVDTWQEDILYKTIVKIENISRTMIRKRNEITTPEDINKVIKNINTIITKRLKNILSEVKKKEQKIKEQKK